MHRNASRLLPGLCRDLADWQSETRRKASGLLPIIILHLESGVTQYTQLLVSGLATGITDAILRTTSTNSGAGSIHLILLFPQRFLPSLDSLGMSTIPQANRSNHMAPSAETGEALHVLHQLFAAGRYVGCFLSSKVSYFCSPIQGPNPFELSETLFSSGLVEASLREYASML